MIDSDNYTAWLQSLKDQGKMKIDIKGTKSVDMKAFSVAIAELLAAHHEDFLIEFYGRAHPRDDYGLRTIIDNLASKIVACMDSNEYVNRNGKFLIRLGKYWKQNYRVMLPSNLLGHVGGMMQNYVFQSREHVVDFTNVFDWPDGHFGKEGSCWWKSAAESLPTFQQGGGWAIRFYANMRDRTGIGRTWILPKYHSLIFFNTYGTQISEVKNVMFELLKSYDTEFEFRMIEAYNSHNENIPYINGGSGFVITTPDNHKMLDSDKERVNVSLRVVTLPKCIVCERKMFHDEVKEIADGIVCEYCYKRHTKMCSYCNELHLEHAVKVLSDVQKNICNVCEADNPVHYCRRCNNHNAECSENVRYCNKCYKVVSKTIVNSANSTESLSEISDRLARDIAAASISAEEFQRDYLRIYEVNFDWNPATPPTTTRRIVTRGATNPDE